MKRGKIKRYIEKSTQEDITWLKEEEKGETLQIGQKYWCRERINQEKILILKFFKNYRDQQETGELLVKDMKLKIWNYRSEIKALKLKIWV